MTADHWRARCAAIADAGWFRAATVAVIVVSAVLLGLETSPRVAAEHGPLFAWLHRAIMLAFVVELGVRMAALGRRWPTFFRSGWNVFDAALVALAFVPAVGPLATAGRVVRVLRVVRLVSVSPQLRLIVTTMLRSIPSLGHVALLLGLLLYVYAVVGVTLFAGVDPAHWGSLGQALLTLFQMLTLEGWVELQRSTMASYGWAWIYYGSFVLIAVFVVMNLFIAVVLANLDDARRQLDPGGVATSLDDVRAEVRALRALIARGAGGGRRRRQRWQLARRAAGRRR